MKKLYSILIALLILTSLQGQILRYSNYTIPTPPASVDTANYYALYDTIYVHMATPPGHDTAHFQSAMVYSLDTLDFVGGSSVWDRLDLFYVFAGRNSTDALINWVNSTTGLYNASNVSGTAWTKWEGFTGDGVADNITTNWEPADGPNYTQNDATIGIYLRINQQEDLSLLGSYDGTYRTSFTPRSTSNAHTARINQATGTSMTATGITVGNGLFLLTRTAADAIALYRNGNLIDNETDASTGLSTTDYAILRSPSTAGYSTNQVAVFFILDGITAAEATAINTIIETYMDALATGVQ